MADVRNAVRALMEPKVWIGAPVYRWQSSRAVNAHRQFLAESVAAGLILGLTTPMDQYITLARNECCRDALENEATHLLCLDDDVCPPRGALKALLAHKKPVVGGLYFDSEFKPVAYSRLDPITPITRELIEQRRKEPLFSALQVECIGMGLTLIEIDVLQAVKRHHRGGPGPHTWFQTPYVQSQLVGDDVYFCETLRALRIPAFVDVNLVCGHIKPYEIGEKGIVT